MHWFLPFFLITGLSSLLLIVGSLDGPLEKSFLRHFYMIYGLALVFAYCVYGFIKIV